MLFLTHGNRLCILEFIEKTDNYLGFTNSLILSTELCCRNWVKLDVFRCYSRFCGEKMISQVHNYSDCDP